MIRRMLRSELRTNVIGRPPARTTRRPVQRFPGVLPPPRTSNSTS